MLQNFVLDNIFATSRVPEGWSGSMWSGWTRSGRSGWPRWSRQSSWSIWSSWFIKRKKSIKKRSTFGPVGQNWPKSAMHEMRFFRTQVPTNVLQGWFFSIRSELEFHGGLPLKSLRLDQLLLSNLLKLIPHWNWQSINARPNSSGPIWTSSWFERYLNYCLILPEWSDTPSLAADDDKRRKAASEGSGRPMAVPWWEPTTASKHGHSFPFVSSPPLGSTLLPILSTPSNLPRSTGNSHSWTAFRGTFMSSARG